MGKWRPRTSRGAGKNKPKSHVRTLWTLVEREVGRQDLDETARICGTTAAEIAKARKAEATRTVKTNNENKSAEKTTGVAEQRPQYGDSAMHGEQQL